MVIGLIGFGGGIARGDIVLGCVSSTMCTSLRANDVGLFMSLNLSNALTFSLTIQPGSTPAAASKSTNSFVAAKFLPTVMA